MRKLKKNRLFSTLLVIGLLGLVGSSSMGSAQEEDEAEEPKVERKAPLAPDGTTFNFDLRDYDLEDLVKRVSEMTGKNFILTESLSGKKVNILSPQKITKEEAYQVFLSVLRTSGYTVVPIGRSLKVVPLSNVSSEPLDIYAEATEPIENFVTRLFKVQNIEVDQISGALGKMISANGSIISYPPTNTLILTDTARNIERIIDIIQRLDVESPTEQLVMIPIRFAVASEIADKLMQVFEEETQATSSRNTSTSRRRSVRNRRRNRRNTRNATASSSSFGGDTPKISKIIADERTNSLIILATVKSLADIQALVSKLDVDVDEALKSDIHVIHLKYAKAEELASTLASLAGTGTGSRTSTARSRNSRTSRTGRNSSRNRNRRTGTASRSSRGRTGSLGGSDSAVATFEGGVRVTADTPTNSLVITASYNDYQTLRRVIDRLDIRRKQVFVEAVILELTQNRDRTVGLNYHGGVPSATDDGSGTIFARGSNSLLPTDSNLLAGLAVGVFGSSITAPTALSALGLDTIPSFGVVLQAIQQDKDVNILSTPSILTSNNEEAKIVVGQNIPFQSGSTISTIGSNISISREDVALTLRVTPQVNYSNEVTLQVFQEITEVVPGTTQDILGPTTTKRSAETVVSVPDNQTVVIGGLISAKENDAEDKIPILGDIPLLGVLFRTKTKTISKSNLLIFLTPHIIDSEEDLLDVYRIKMAQRQEFIRRFYGKTREEQIEELNSLMKYSMNLPEVPSVYPERDDRVPMESTIETTTRSRGFIAPIPGAENAGDGPVVVPIFGDEPPEEKAAKPPEAEGASMPSDDATSNDVQVIEHNGGSEVAPEGE